MPSSETYDTLLDGVSVAFKDLGGKEEPSWRRVVINDDVHIISMREVRVYQASSGACFMCFLTRWPRRVTAYFT